MSGIGSEQVGHLVDEGAVERLDVMGPTVDVLTPPTAGDADPCLLRGTVPPGVAVPLHAHPDPETFIAISGELEGLCGAGDDLEWVPLRAGEIFHVPGAARHGWRNVSAAPAVTFIVTTSRMARFFAEIGTPVVAGGAQAGPPSPPVIARFLEVSARYGYWNASPEENARYGITPPGA